MEVKRDGQYIKMSDQIDQDQESQKYNNHSVREESRLRNKIRDKGNSKPLKTSVLKKKWNYRLTKIRRNNPLSMKVPLRPAHKKLTISPETQKKQIKRKLMIESHKETAIQYKSTNNKNVPSSKKTVYPNAKRTTKLSSKTEPGVKEDIKNNTTEASTSNAEAKSKTYWQNRHQDIEKAYTLVLNRYASSAKHHNTIKQLLERKQDSLSFTIDEETGLLKVNLSDNHHDFLNELTLLLSKHSERGTLSRELKAALEPFGIKFEVACKQGFTWTITLSIPDTISTTKTPKRKDSINEEDIKKHITDDIKSLEKTKITLMKKHSFLVNITKLLKQYDIKWENKSTPEKIFLGNSSKNAEKAASLHLLNSIHSRLEAENKELLNYIDSVMTLLNDNKDCLLNFKQETKEADILTTASESLSENNRSHSDMAKGLLFSTKYQLEKDKKENTLTAINELQSAAHILTDLTFEANGQEITDVEKNIFYQYLRHLITLCIRDALPESLFKIGKLKISSSFRKDWKSQLLDWDITRANNTMK